jgi:hypothetical protein
MLDLKGARTGKGSWDSGGANTEATTTLFFVREKNETGGLDSFKKGDVV